MLGKCRLLVSCRRDTVGRSFGVWVASVWVCVCWGPFICFSCYSGGLPLVFLAFFRVTFYGFDIYFSYAYIIALTINPIRLGCVAIFSACRSSSDRNLFFSFYLTSQFSEPHSHFTQSFFPTLLSFYFYLVYAFQPIYYSKYSFFQTISKTNIRILSANLIEHNGEVRRKWRKAYFLFN